MKNLPFVDGNKRVGAVLLELFLDINGFDFFASDDEMLPIMLGVAAGEISNEELIDWIRENSVRRS